jgi:hypothetical protein
MNLTSLRSSQAPVANEPSSDIRSSHIKRFEQCILTGRNLHYPNCLLETQTQTKPQFELVNPYDERVMSLKRDSFYDNDTWNEYVPQTPHTLETNPAFFFIYNVDNYYHFLYDTLPYLSAYFQLKQQFPALQLLINTSHPTKQSLPPFVMDALSQLGLRNRIQFAKPGQVYQTLFVATSLTHGGRSNEPPPLAAFDVWRRFPISSQTLETPKRFYVSRRSWVHGQTANMGTNYTMRRKCENEDEVVALLAKYDIEEVFTELLSMEEKIAYFKSAELVVGVIGGGMCNLLFSPPETRSVCIATPYFLDINARFRYSIEHTQFLYSHCATHAPYAGKFPLYSRVKIINPASLYIGCIGEVEAVHSATNEIQLNLSSNDVAGFSQDFQLKTVWVKESDVEPLDFGLNSPYCCNLEKLEADIKRILNIE